MIDWARYCGNRTILVAKAEECIKNEHIGQIETYMRYIDKNLRTITQDKTIGIIICKKDNNLIMNNVVIQKY